MSDVKLMKYRQALRRIKRKTDCNAVPYSEDTAAVPFHPVLWDNSRKKITFSFSYCYIMIISLY